MKLLIAFALICFSQALVPLLEAEGPIVPNSYLISFSLNSTFAQTENVLSKTQVETVYSNLPGLRLFHVIMTDEQLQAVREDNTGSILYIQRNQIVSLQQNCATQKIDIWNLPRVSNKAPDGPKDYIYPSTAGEGVTSYIIDTGIYTEHDEFKDGRAVWGANFVDKHDQDLNGHGTHVAGTVGGETYGIAKKVKLVAVKVLDEEGSGTLTGVIDGINWVASNCPNPRKCNANLSLGASRNTAVNDAVTSLVSVGVTVVVAAGNSNDDACYYSPASATGAICVGATDSKDVRSTFSNYGSCVTVFAPGTNIKSAWIGSRTATDTISGTSMASPHVCGVAALIQASGNLPPSQVASTIKSTGQTGVLDLSCRNNACQSSPNLFLHHAC